MTTFEKWAAGFIGFWFIGGIVLVSVSGVGTPVLVWGLPFLAIWLLIGGLGLAAKILRRFGL